MDETAVVIPLTLIIYTLAVAFRYQAQLRSSRAQEKLDQMSCLDMLTGVGNVTKLERDVAHMAPELMSVCLVDVDDFKGINDTHGHLTGNQVLRCVALSLEDAFRDVGNCYRVGGDEFVVLAQGVDTQQLALRLRQAQGYLSTRMAQLGLGDVVTISAGVACAFDGGAAAGTEVAQVSAGATQVQCAQAQAAVAGAQPHAYYGGGYGTEVGTSVGTNIGTSFDNLVELNSPRRRRVSTAREIARLLDPPRYPALLQLADKRLYQSKARGKACVTW
ncbi:MAG: GGDEF domain-containing protein [Atopobiaceae bacterium]